MKDKIITLLLAVIVFITALNYVESCTAREETNRQLKKKMQAVNDRIDTLKSITESRRDTVNYINHYQTKIIQQAEGAKDEVNNTNDMDGVVRNYYKYRPSKSN